MFIFLFWSYDMWTELHFIQYQIDLIQKIKSRKVLTKSASI